MFHCFSFHKNLILYPVFFHRILFFFLCIFCGLFLMCESRKTVLMKKMGFMGNTFQCMISLFFPRSGCVLPLSALCKVSFEQFPHKMHHPYAIGNIARTLKTQTNRNNVTVTMRGKSVSHDKKMPMSLFFQYLTTFFPPFYFFFFVF